MQLTFSENDKAIILAFRAEKEAREKKDTEKFWKEFDQRRKKEREREELRRPIILLDGDNW